MRNNHNPLTFLMALLEENMSKTAGPKAALEMDNAGSFLCQQHGWCWKSSLGLFMLKISTRAPASTTPRLGLQNHSESLPVRRRSPSTERAPSGRWRRQWRKVENKNQKKKSGVFFNNVLIWKISKFKTCTYNYDQLVFHVVLDSTSHHSLLALLCPFSLQD